MAPRQTLKKRPPRRKALPTVEPHLAEAVTKFLGKGPEHYTAEEWVGICNQVGMQALHPGKWVAWRDHWRGRGRTARLVHREILFAGRTSSEVSRFLSRLTTDEMYGVFMGYMPTDDDLPSL